MRKKTLQTIAWVLLGLGTIISLFIVVKACVEGIQIFTTDEIDFAITGQFGDFVGGVVGTIISGAGFIFLYLTFKEQRDSVAIERFESKFFELVKIHRENVSNMILDIGNKRIEGNLVVKIVSDQIAICREEINPFFSKKDVNQIYNRDYLSKVKLESTINERNLSLKELSKNDISYSIVFFGLDYNGFFVLKKLLAERYNKEFYEPIIYYLSLKPNEESGNWQRWRKIRRLELDRKSHVVNEIFRARKQSRPKSLEDFSVSKSDFNDMFYKDDFEKFYCGFQLQLGHYFRHLFQSFNYINDQQFLTYSDKYYYAKIYRAQLSTYEQVVFFFNSLSSMGNVWELILAERFKKPLKEVSESDVINKQLITKYNMIKNLPSGQLFRQDFSKFYPNAEYEFRHFPVGREALLKLYI